MVENRVNAVSGPLSIFLRINDPFEAVIRLLEKFFNLSLNIETNESGFLSKLCAMQIEFSIFSNHGLEDDCGIDFSNYSIQIDMLKIYPKTRNNYQDQLVKVTAFFLAQEISNNFKCKSIVVENLQKIIGDFK